MEPVADLVTVNRVGLKLKKCILSFLAVTLFLFIALFICLKVIYPTTSPFKAAQYIVVSLGHPHAKMIKQTIGFLPYWRLDDSKYIHLDLLSEIIFFSLSADENGQFIKVVGNKKDPGWRWWNSPTIQDLIAKTQISGSKFSLTVAMQNNKTLESFLSNKTAQQTLINNLLEIVKSSKLNGLNVDFEYDGKPDDSYRQKFTQFSQELNSNFRSKSPNTELSIDFFPLSIEKPRLYDVANLIPLFDRSVIMSYDYYASSSEVAGPVAPMSGYKEQKYFFDVETTYQDYLKVVPKEKIIMGIPYYSWDFPVEDSKSMSKVLPQNDQNGYPVVLSYGRLRNGTDIKDENCQWDDLAKENFCFYQDPQTKVAHQVWLEDNRSIETKFDFAKTHDLAGIAIWTVGFDKNYTDLWQMIANKFTKP